MMRTTVCAVWVLALLTLSGCSLVADFDRSKIDRKLPVDAAGIDAASIDAASIDAAGFDAAGLFDATVDAAHVDAGGMDASQDSGMDASQDSGMDAAVEAGMDADVDASGMDAAMDAGDDAATDAGEDAAVDAGEDAGMDAGPPECLIPIDCGANGACFVRTCTLGACGMINLGNGADALSGQTPGNCKRIVCDGSGGSSEINDNSDVENDGKQCTTDTCSSGSPVHTPIGAGMTCSQSGGTVCSSAGDCVQCLMPSHCGANTNCVTYSCTGSFTCQQTNTSSGTPTTDNPAQTTGDCKEIRCNGSGGTLNANVNDIHDDSLECTVDTCNAGSVVHTPKNPGVACTQGGGSTCNATGQCVACDEDSDCGEDTDCVTYTCNMGACEQDEMSEGTVTTGNPAQIPGDCKEIRCDGDGDTVEVAVNDVNDDSKECTIDTCSMGMAVHTPKTTGVSCTQGGGDYCAADGDCVECIDAEDCGTSDDCITYTCSMDGACGEVHTGAGTATTGNPAQIAGDCKEIRCNGSGGTITANVNDPINDNNVCTDDVCTMGMPTNPDTAPGATCQTTNVCDGDGNCVDCVDDMDCGSSICVDETCYMSDDLFDADVAGNDNVVGEVNQLTFDIVTTTPWPSDGILTITFGSAFDISGASLASTTGLTGTLDLDVDGNDLVLTRSGGSTKAPGAFRVVINEVGNPSVSGTSASFAIATRTAAGTEIDSGTAPGLNIAAGTLTDVSVDLSDQTTNASGEVAVTFTLANPWPANGRIHIELPPELDATAATLQSVTGPAGSFTLTRMSQSMQITHDTGAMVTDPGTEIVIVLANVTNPAAETTTMGYAIFTMESDQDVIDSATAPGTMIVDPP